MDAARTATLDPRRHGERLPRLRRDTWRECRRPPLSRACHASRSRESRLSPAYRCQARGQPARGMRSDGDVLANVCTSAGGTIPGRGLSLSSGPAWAFAVSHSPPVSESAPPTSLARFMGECPRCNEPPRATDRPTGSGILSRARPKSCSRHLETHLKRGVGGRYFLLKIYFFLMFVL